MTKKSFYKVKNETYKVIRHYPSKGDADGPLPRALLRMVPRGGGAAIAKGPQGHYVIYLDRSGKIDGAPVWLKPAQYKRAMSYEYSEEREMGNLDQLIEDLRSGKLDEDLVPSGAKKFQFASPPKVKSASKDDSPPKKGTKVIINGSKYDIQKVLESGLIGKQPAHQVVVKRPRGKKMSTAIVWKSKGGSWMARMYIELWFPGARTYSAFKK